MDLKSLDYFIHTANCLNFTQAAKECYISQTAISLTIARMESELGFQLFDRNNRVVKLTDAGSDFYNWANQVLQSYDNTVKRGVSIEQGYSGSIKLAFTSCFDALAFMPQLKAFHKDYPGININICLHKPNNMLQALKSRAVDAVVCWPYDLDKDEEILVYDIRTVDITLAINRSHPFASMQHIPLEQLRNEECLYLSNSNQPIASQDFMSKLARAGLSTTNMHECQHAEEVFLQLELNNCIAIVPEYFRNFTNSNTVYRSLDIAPSLSTRISFCRLKSNKNPALELLRSAMRVKNAFETIPDTQFCIDE